MNPQARAATTNEHKQAEAERDESQSDKTDLSDVGLCSMNKSEMLYNVTLCLLKLKRFKKARKCIGKLMRVIPQKYADDVVRL